jgi:hypothetical protein
MKIDKPEIFKIEATERKIVINWNISNELNYTLTRYRVQYSKIKNGIQDSFTDWPGEK